MNTRSYPRQKKGRRSLRSLTQRNNTNYVIQTPTKSNATKVLKLILNMKQPHPALLSDIEIAKICQSELFPQKYRTNFTVSGFMTNCMFLKNTSQSKRIFDTYVNLFPLIYGKSLTKDDIKNIKLELHFFFNNNDDRVQEIKGGVNGRVFSFVFLAFMDIGLITNMFLLRFYYGSLVLGIDQCVTDLSKIVDQFDVNVLATTGKPMDHFHRKIFGNHTNSSDSILGIALDSTAWLIYTEKVRKTESFRETQSKIIKYVQLGIHGITSSVDFGDYYWRERYDFENKEDIEYRADTKTELKKIDKATRLATRIVNDEADTIEANKVYTEESIEDLKRSVADIVEIEEKIQTIMKSTEKSNKKVIAHEEFLNLIDLMDIKFGILQDYRMNLELRPPPAECHYKVTVWNDVKTYDDYLSFATETFVGSIKQMQQIISNAVAYQTNLIKQITKDMIDIYQNVWDVIGEIQIIFKKARDLTNIDLPTQYTLMVFLWKKLHTVFPLIAWYILSFFAFIGGMAIHACSAMRGRRPQLTYFQKRRGHEIAEEGETLRIKDDTH